MRPLSDGSIRRVVAFDLLRDALSAIFGLSELKTHYMLTCGRDLGNELTNGVDAALAGQARDANRKAMQPNFRETGAKKERNALLENALT
ncbi:hypothetical protein Tco_0116906 [Tanacetum coccineum]